MIKTGMISVLSLSLLAAPSFTHTVTAVGSGPEVNENQEVKIERLTSYEEMVKKLDRVNKKVDHMSVEVIGESVKGRDLHLVKFGDDENNPTLLLLTQQHGNEPLLTESVLKVIQELSANSKEVKNLLDQVNILFVPRLNPDGAEGDVDWDSSHLQGGGQQTRNNANGINLNRTHNSLSQPETRALHENVLEQYDIDYAIDLHHQVANRAIDNEGKEELVSGAMLFPTASGVSDEVLESSKKLGAVVNEAVEKKGYSTLARYNVMNTLTSNARNHFAAHYDIPTILFENRGLSDSPNTSSILGQKSSGYLIGQGKVVIMAAIKAIADQSIEDANISIWDSLPEQYTVEDDNGE
ncbi:M14 family zinc carboxypeptidase [Alteribacillus sp. JSM 102045]|uniref:M14 family zinc carboxypeptidase n=1 Tax=Alteribacillus sp. JSM 102045 TaxID=1562101 RepID=UPI0035BFCC8B